MTLAWKGLWQWLPQCLALSSTPTVEILNFVSPCLSALPVSVLEQVGEDRVVGEVVWLEAMGFSFSETPPSPFLGSA